MGKIAPVKPVLLICGFIYGDDEIFKAAADNMISEFGPILQTQAEYDFDHTDYYTKEMGSHLKRKFLAFEKPINPDDLADIKLRTNDIESEYQNKAGGRKINIDPGYLDPARLVLASTKDFSHRIYLGKGIYGEITMTYENGNFRFYPWTYPDYQDERTIAFLQAARVLSKEIGTLKNV